MSSFTAIRAATRAAAALAALALALALGASAWAADAAPRAGTPQGVLEGESLGKVVAFRGIPYAAPPVGELRFRPPQAPAAWRGTRPALDMGPSCPQLIDDDPTENNNSAMAEDCLSLNVWTPRVDTGKRPVMLWIHGGAFVVGSSRNTYYDGQHLAAHGDVVVVSINYRLGAWGFLSLGALDPDYAESANLGLLDQIAALQWVRKNIAAFGGDPANVTIFGESAGASSVGALLSLPAAKGLFAKAILQSGVPSARSLAAAQRGQTLAAQFLKLAGVQAPAGLKSKSMRELLDVQQRIFSEYSDLGTFVPSIDGTVIKEQPFAVVAEGRGHRVPVLIGTTAEEMRYFSTAEDLGLERKPRALLLEQLGSIFGNRAPAVLSVYEALYPDWGDLVVQVASDAILRQPSIHLAERISAFQPVYMYRFTYRSNSTYEHFGSAHAMEVPFVFGVLNYPEVIVFTGRDPARATLAAATMSAWASFARNGSPSVPSGPVWPRYDAAKRATLELGPTIRVVDDPLSQQRQAWGDALPPVDKTWVLLQRN